MSLLLLLVFTAGCSSRVDYLADVNGAPLPCREAGRIASAVRGAEGSIETQSGQPITSVELVQDREPAETLVVAGQVSVRAVGRRAKVCNEQFLVVGAGRTPYAIVGDIRGD